MDLGKKTTGLRLSLESRARSPGVVFSVRHWAAWVGRCGTAESRGSATSTGPHCPLPQGCVRLPHNWCSRDRRKVEGVEFAFSCTGWILSFKTYLLSTYPAPGTALHTGDTSVNKTGKNPCLCGTYILMDYPRTSFRL